MTHPAPSESERASFEAWITLPPFEKDVDRRPEHSAWPWKYRDYSVEMAWEAWQARASLPAPTGWQQIETAPKGGEKFLAWRRHSTLPLIVFYNEDYDQYESNEGNLVFSLTHWMPLPAAPSQEGRDHADQA